MKLTKLLSEALLAERYITLISKDQRKPYLPLIWDMLQKAYANIGGFKSTDSPEGLLDETSLWKLVRKNNKIVAVSIYSDKLGRKTIGAATDGSEEGKAALKQIWIDDIKQNRSWAEVSGAAKHIKKKLGISAIPNKYAAEILQKPIISLNPDGYHYTRTIAGEHHEKLLVGKIEGYSFE